jgi:hypothetical protein
MISARTAASKIEETQPPLNWAFPLELLFTSTKANCWSREVKVTAILIMRWLRPSERVATR